MTLEKYFLELAEIDNVHPEESKVLDYVKSKLRGFKVPFKQDKFGNIVAFLNSAHDNRQTIGLSGHVDIAAPLKGRRIIKTKDIIKTDGTSILGGDDKSAVAAMLKLAEEWSLNKASFINSAELIFTVGEEAGLQGAKNLDYELVKSKDILVFDWEGSVNRMITRAPAYVKIDIEFIGKSAHPAEWQDGINAGQYLMRAASKFDQGELRSGVTFNIGQVSIGQARNQVPEQASLHAEVRSFDIQKANTATRDITDHFKQVANQHGIKVEIVLDAEAAEFSLDKRSAIHNQIVASLSKIGLDPIYEETYGCFDGNVFAKHGKNVVILGAGWYKPHGPNEYLDRREFAQMYDFTYRLFAV